MLDYTTTGTFLAIYFNIFPMDKNVILTFSAIFNGGITDLKLTKSLYIRANII